MDVLIKKCTIIDSDSPHNGKQYDVLIEKGIISKISKNITNDNAKLIEGSKLFVSPGWVDIGAITGEPGEEHRDTIRSTLNSAAKGGFTQVCLMTNKHTPIDSTSLVKYVQTKESDHAVTCHTIGALTQHLLGKDLSEMIDMNQAGAVGFSDGLNSIQEDGMISRALQYSRSFDGLIIHHPGNENFYAHSHIHEGDVSTSLGLTGMPSVAEAIMIDRDIQLVEYTGGKMLLHLISSKEGVAKIKASKSANLFASVSYQNLIEIDEDVALFDANRKVLPPLRDKNDRSSLLRGVNTGVIDVICSNHVPLDQEAKKKEFTYAEFGAIGLQTCGLHMMQILEPRVMVNSLAINPRKILGMPSATIEESKIAEITIWDTDSSYEFTARENESLSGNSPYLGATFPGRIIGIINNKKNILSIS